MLDPISEMLTKIRNAQMAQHKTVIISASKLKMALAKILEKEGFVDAVAKEKQANFDVIKITLKYYTISNTNKTPAVKGIRRISKEGQRIYVKSKDVRSVKNNYGVALISTSKGVMTDHDAKKAGLGGEYIRRGIIPREPRPGYNVGFTANVLFCCVVVPTFGILIAIISNFTRLIHLVKIKNFTTELEKIIQTQMQFSQTPEASKNWPAAENVVVEEELKKNNPNRFMPPQTAEEIERRWKKK